MTDLRHAKQLLGALKNTGTPYYRAHVIVVQLREAALAAMREIPAPEAEDPTPEPRNAP